MHTSALHVDARERSRDGSVKLRLRTDDGFPIEAVLMRFERGGGGEARRGELPPRYTACLSSQSGCALACTFCATGAMGLGRNLAAHEITGQFEQLAALRAELDGGGRIDNVVMMGMGEPFHNYDEVLAAVRALTDQRRHALPPRRLTVSTVGWVPGIERLTREDVPVRLALSLHATTDDERSQLMPVNRRYPIARVLEACRAYTAQTGRRIFVQYLLLEGVNDSPRHATQLVDLLRDGDFHVNLIAYNPAGSEFTGSGPAVVREFSQIVRDGGIPRSYRVSRATDISGACGQLAAPVAAARRLRRMSAHVPAPAE